MDADEHLAFGRRADGSIMWRVQLLRWLAKAVRIQFKIGGIPYGASYERAINRRPLRDGVGLMAGPLSNGETGLATTTLAPESSALRLS